MTSPDQDSDGQNSLLNYEAESFESWPGSDRTCTSSRSFESQKTYFCHSDSSFGDAELDSQSHSGITPSTEGYENDDFEEDDEKGSAMEEELREKWIRVLRRKTLPSSAPHPKQRSNCSPHRGGGKLCLEERVALQAFCQERIRHTQSLQWTSPPAHRTQPGRHTEPCPETGQLVADRLVPKQLISVLRMKSFTEEMKKAIETELHQPSHCGPCRENLARLAQDTFIRRKRSQLECGLLEDKLQAHLYEKDAICLVGELLSDIPKISDDPSEIWRGLLTNGRWTPQ
ncbi:uncharacterized protein C8orf48 homolog [Conger conger]|nr:uncharacterized protein C8orf48 homolog [Conger conger]